MDVEPSKQLPSTQGQQPVIRDDVLANSTQSAFKTPLFGDMDNLQLVKRVPLFVDITTELRETIKRNGDWTDAIETDFERVCDCFIHQSAEGFAHIERLWSVLRIHFRDHPRGELYESIFVSPPLKWTTILRDCQIENPTAELLANINPKDVKHLSYEEWDKLFGDLPARQWKMLVNRLYWLP